MPSSGCQTCALDRKSTRLNSSHTIISYAVFCLKKKCDRAQETVLGRWSVRWCARVLRHVGAPFVFPGSPHGRLWQELISTCIDLLFFLMDTATPEFYPLPLPAAFPI